MKTAEFITEILDEANSLRREAQEAHRAGAVGTSTKVLAEALYNDLRALKLERLQETVQRRGRRVVELEQRNRELERELRGLRQPTSRRRGRKAVPSVALRALTGNGSAARLQIGNVRIDIISTSPSR